MFMLARLWRWWSGNWKAPRRARWLYVAMTISFGGLALVAVLAGVAAIATIVLAALAPRLSRGTDR
jgi:hypothetical protein